MDSMNMMSPADFKAISDGNEFGGGWMWIIILFLFLFGIGGNGFARNNDALTKSEMQQGFDTAEVTRKLDGITNGLCDGFYAQNTTMLNGFAGITTAVREAQFAAQQCCCETNRNIDSVRYDAQKNTCDIINAIHAEGEATRSLIQANEVQALRDKVQSLELRDAMCGVVRYPNSWAYNAGTSPFCGCNTGCCNI